MTGESDSRTIVALLTFFCTLFLFPMALIDWQTPTMNELFWFVPYRLLRDVWPLRDDASAGRSSDFGHTTDHVPAIGLGFPARHFDVR